jgi:hypothetical protein
MMTPEWELRKCELNKDETATTKENSQIEKPCLNFGEFLDRSSWIIKLPKCFSQTLVRLGSGDPSTSDIALVARFFGILINRPCGESLVKSLKWPMSRHFILRLENTNP